MAKKQSQLDLSDMAHRTQALFTVNGAVGAQMERFLEMQDNLLNESGIFARRWFERRHQANETAIEALHEMNSTGASDPAQAMTEWQRGSFERMMADVQEWAALWMRGAGAATTAQFDAIETGADRAEADKAKGKSASKPSSGHATPV